VEESELDRMLPDLLSVQEQIKAARDLPMPDRELTMRRVLALFLHRYNRLPDDLKQFLDN
jgi:hypothetical protein